MLVQLRMVVGSSSLEKRLLISEGEGYRQRFATSVNPMVGLGRLLPQFLEWRLMELLISIKKFNWLAHHSYISAGIHQKLRGHVLLGLDCP